MSSRVVLFASLVLALGAGLALYLIAADEGVERAVRSAGKSGGQAKSTESSRATADEGDESEDNPEEGAPAPLRSIDEILASLEAGSGGAENLVRRDLRHLRAVLANLRGAVDRSTRRRVARLLITLEPEWRAHAGTVVGELQPDPDTVNELLQMLRADGIEASTRRGVLNALSGMPAEAATQPLLELIEKDHPQSPNIVTAVARIGEPDAMHTMVAWLDRPISPATRLQIEKALTLEAGEAALDEAMSKLRTASADKRLSLLLVVSRIGGKQYSEAVRRALAMSLQPKSREAAIRALGTIGDPEAGRILWILAQSEDPEEARLATRSLARIRSRETLDVLITEASAMPSAPLRAILEAGASIRRPGPALLDLADRQLTAEDKQSRVAAITVAGASRDPRYIPALGNLYEKRRDRATREAILGALWDMQQREATRTALVLLETTPAGKLRDLNLKRFKSRAGLRPEDAPR